MNFFEYARVALESLRANRLRSALTMLGVIIGVAAVILLVSLGEGTKKYVEEQFAGLGSNILIVTPGKIETKGGPPVIGAAKHKLTLSDSYVLEKKGYLFGGVAPVVFGTAEVRSGSRSRNVPVLGVTPSFSHVRNLHVEIGSFVSESDVEAKRRVCVLGRTVKRELFGNANALGQMVKVSGGRFRVVGIMQSKGVSLGIDLDDIVFVPVRSAQDIFDTDALLEIILSVRNKNDIDSAKELARSILFKNHNRHEDFTITNQAAMLSSLYTILDTMTYVLGGIATISLLVGGIGIMNIMLVTVKERTNEIGIRKAVGARDRDILVQFLLESTALSSSGGIGGMLVGVLGAYGIRLLVPKLPVEVPSWAIVLAFTFSVFVGIFFGVYPARKAAALHPIEALRYE
ncbi:MAG TPA: ABC transporter permease [Candidatus Deferrimicrobiaceae bacterium]|jgi:putative ABC transport system permease protein|nr:ABC transporter permease [Candidatus Deferrimicrobiaceae bacterium]HJX74457.1 ABC transporter permease [Candidatus Deferrimicrobiaceae bacterium]